MADGQYAQNGYDLPNTNYILAFGAGILESENPLAARILNTIGKETGQGRPVRMDDHLEIDLHSDGYSPSLAYSEKAKRVYLAVPNFVYDKILVHRSDNKGHSFGSPVDGSLRPIGRQWNLMPARPRSTRSACRLW